MKDIENHPIGVLKLRSNTKKKKPESGFSTSIFIYNEQNEQLKIICEHLHMSKSKVIAELIKDEYMHHRILRKMEE